MKYLIYSCVFMLLIACGVFKGNNSSNESTLIELKKTSCRGQCPVYTIIIYTTGKMTYKGEKNVEKQGRYEKKMSEEGIEKLIKTFKAAKFWDFKDEYTSRITDLPTTFISFSNKGKTKKIRDYHGAPEELKALEKMIEDIANAEGWSNIEE
ncbi:MAG: hypothetical protein IH946_08145 [Bacteroidetes bacterium]|nr:hypothetical protein [Bacteroidota bacterium]